MLLNIKTLFHFNCEHHHMSTNIQPFPQYQCVKVPPIGLYSESLVPESREVRGESLQETWMTAPEGKDYWEKEHIGCLFIYSGEKTMPALGRQGRGVALVLGPQMGRAWRASGSQVISSGPRHLLIDNSICGMQKEKQRE